MCTNMILGLLGVGVRAFREGTTITSFVQDAILICSILLERYFINVFKTNYIKLDLRYFIIVAMISNVLIIS